MEKKTESDESREQIRIWSTGQFNTAFSDLVAKKPKEAVYVPLKVTHMSTNVEAANKHRNNVEFDEIHDFSQVSQIMVSKETKCPLKPGYSYVTVILWFGAETYMMFPYVFKEKIKGKGKNSLKQWTLVNKNMQSAHHDISSYKQL